MANHGGLFVFRVCNADGIENPTQSCFDKNVLRIVSAQNKTEVVAWLSNTEKVTIDTYGKNGRHIKKMTTYKYLVQLPADLTCKHCIFQVKLF